MGKVFIILGVLFIVTGILILTLNKIPFFSHFGNLPGDIRIKRDGFSFYFPLATCLLISLTLSGIGYLLRYFFQR